MVELENMGNICPANKGNERAFKGNREAAYKLNPRLNPHGKSLNNGHDANTTNGGYPILTMGNGGAANLNNNNNLMQAMNNNSNNAHTSFNNHNGFTNFNGISTNQLMSQQQQHQGGAMLNQKTSVLEKPNYIALFDYESATKDDMTIKKNDQLIVIDKSHPDWWLAKNLRTKETGYVPFNYITTIDDLQIKEWFFPNTSRREAERLLEYLDNEPGVFLIRESEQDNGKCWSLSILDYNDEKQRHTKHYRIRKTDDGGCFISARNRFDSLDELVQFYSSKFD